MLCIRLCGTAMTPHIPPTPLPHGIVQQITFIARVSWITVARYDRNVDVDIALGEMRRYCCRLHTLHHTGDVIIRCALVVWCRGYTVPRSAKHIIEANYYNHYIRTATAGYCVNMLACIRY